MKDLFNSTSQSKRIINANKYTYNRAADKVTEVSEIMQQQLVAAVNNIVNKEDQTVLINSAGINIGGSSKYQMRLVDNMIAMTDDSWKTAKLAIGLFATKDVGTQWGVNAEMLAGNVMIGNKLILQNPNDDGYMMFQVDETGAWLYNSQFVLQDGDTGGLIVIDPKYGIVAGTKLLFDTNGTTVTPEFMDDAGDITFDSEGMPTNANFFLDIDTGNAYFRGKIRAKSGLIGGYTIEDSYLYAGTRTGKDYVALNGGRDVYSAYAIWAGYDNPDSTLCPFWVKKDGTLHAKGGDFDGGTFKNITATSGTFQNITVSGSSKFSGTLNAPKLSGTMTSGDGTGWIEGCGIRVGKNSSAANGYNFYVDTNGNVSMQGNLTLGTGVIKWNNLSEETKNKVDEAGTEAEKIAKDIADGKYSKGTFIKNNEIFSPVIRANEFSVQPDSTSTSGGFSIYGYGYSGQMEKVFGISYSMRNSLRYINISGSSGSGGYVGSSATWEIPTAFDANISIGSGKQFFATNAVVSFQNSSVDFTGATVKGLSNTAVFG